jgi:hypothetical protein
MAIAPVSRALCYREVAGLVNSTEAVVRQTLSRRHGELPLLTGRVDHRRRDEMLA